MNSLISVIIPTFNEGKNIARLLESIKKQSYKRIEIIVVDDASKDNTVSISKNLGAKVFKRKHAERSVQRNFGASKAKGKFLIFLDADMELTSDVIKDCVSTAGNKYKLLVIPERTIGNNFLGKIRNFEREMYMGDSSVEVARFFDAKIFQEFKGYDPDLTGPEDYDLPYRISRKYKIGRSKEYILHHEENTTLSKLLKRKYYYARRGALHALKHPELVASQGNLFFRKAYLENWKKFLKEPVLGIAFIAVRSLETIWAVAGFVNAVGVIGFTKAFINMLK